MSGMVPCSCGGGGSSCSCCTGMGANGSLNGTTPVTLVPAPATTNQNAVSLVTVFNADSAAVVIFLQVDDSAHSNTILFSTTLQPGDNLAWDDGVVLDTTTKTLVAYLGGAIATTNPTWTVSYGNVVPTA